MDYQADFSACYLVYNRKSTDDAENQKNSLAYQRQRNLAYAEQERLPIASLTVLGYCEDGVIDEKHSGYKEEVDFDISDDGFVQHRVLRPKFLWLVRLLKEKRIKGVIFLTWDRASRNRQDDVIIQKLKKLGCDIRFAETTYDRSSAGELHMNVDGMVASHYSRVISEKVHNAYAKLHAEGRCTYRSPIGYLDHGSDKKLLDPERAPIVKRIFELYATGDWSIRELGKWAHEQGLTQKPSRRKRTAEEMLNNLELDTLPKIARPADHKTVEYILRNPFYIGKIRVGDGYQTGKFHAPLIDVALFQKVQELLTSRNVSVAYIDKPFFIARGLLRCTCGRVYTPYLQKGTVYYRSRCKPGCANPDPNLTDGDVAAAVKSTLDRIHYKPEEHEQIKAVVAEQYEKTASDRNKALDDLTIKQRRILDDIDYLTENRITLLRTGSFTPEALKADEDRLAAELARVTAEIGAYAETAIEMLRYIFAFSELLEMASLCYEIATDHEKRTILTDVFSELVFADKKLVKYTAKDGFGAILDRSVLLGSPVRLFSELSRMYELVRISRSRWEAHTRSLVPANDNRPQLRSAA